MQILHSRHTDKQTRRQHSNQCYKTLEILKTSFINVRSKRRRQPSNQAAKQPASQQPSQTASQLATQQNTSNTVRGAENTSESLIIRTPNWTPASHTAKQLARQQASPPTTHSAHPAIQPASAANQPPSQLPEKTRKHMQYSVWAPKSSRKLILSH